MMKQATNETRGFQFVHIQMNQTVPRMAQTMSEKISVQCEEGWLAESEQERDDFIIVHPLLSYLITNLTKGHMPSHQQLSLAFEDVFIEDIHAGVGSSTNSFACLRKASPDNLMASAIASFVMLW